MQPLQYLKCTAIKFYRPCNVNISVVLLDNDMYIESYLLRFIFYRNLVICYIY